MNMREDTCHHRTAADFRSEAQNDFASWLAQRLRRALRALRDVLRGYCAGQPVNESRPRKGCC